MAAGIFEAGVFLIDKPTGPSSFRIIQQVRRALGVKKVGHSGTLDPFASGLLIVCAGRPATRIISRLMDGDKEYEALLKLGVETDTQDLEGRVTAEYSVDGVDLQGVTECLNGFLGEQLQQPPAFSALKHKGKPLYHYARQGIVIEKKPRLVLIRDISCLSLDSTELRIRVRCGKGTYIRTLAADIGRQLRCGAHLIELRRTKNGPFSVEDAISGVELSNKEKAGKVLLANMLTVDQALGLR